MKFIKLHTETGDSRYINPDKITYFLEHERSTGTHTRLVMEDNILDVKETPEEVLALISGKPLNTPVSGSTELFPNTPRISVGDTQLKEEHLPNELRGRGVWTDIAALLVRHGYTVSDGYIQNLHINSPSRFVNLVYDKTRGFYINATSSWIEPMMIEQYGREANLAISLLKQCVDLLRKSDELNERK